MAQNLFKSVVSQYKSIIDYPFGILDDEFYVIASTDESAVGKCMPELEDFIKKDSHIILNRNTAYQPIYVKGKLEFIVYLESTDASSIKLLNILSIALLNLKQVQDEKLDKSIFIKHLLQDSILPSDIYVKAKELRISTDTKRVVYLIKVASEHGETVYDILYSMYPSKNVDFIVSIDEETIVLVKEMGNNVSSKDIDKEAMIIKNTINSEALCTAKIGIGSYVETVREIAMSYKEAKIAIEVSKVFDTEKDVINYEHLGIGRLIYQLPTTLCKKFLDEVFKKDSLEELDEDTIATIQKFFENSLNISETARKLFIHRNTLVYRLDKIQKNTGLDLRQFDDAIIFKIAMMVKKYLSANVVKL
ncbi:MAG: PucR family transcriptional regulator [Ruminococcaceae bacterium]|nr:PucR family transcriptional regulator [Oscillospiraceae bacterium]